MEIKDFFFISNSLYLQLIYRSLASSRKGKSTVYIYTLNFFELSVDSERWWLEHFMPLLRVWLLAEGDKNVSWPWLSPLRGWGSLIMAFTDKFVCINLTIFSCYSSTTLTLVFIERNGGLSTLCHGCRFDYEQRVLKTFSGPGYFLSEDRVVWMWQLLVNL